MARGESIFQSINVNAKGGDNQTEDLSQDVIDFG